MVGVHTCGGSGGEVFWLCCVMFFFFDAEFV